MTAREEVARVLLSLGDAWFNAYPEQADQAEALYLQRVGGTPQPARSARVRPGLHRPGQRGAAARGGEAGHRNVDGRPEAILSDGKQRAELQDRVGVAADQRDGKDKECRPSGWLNRAANCVLPGAGGVPQGRGGGPAGLRSETQGAERDFVVWRHLRSGTNRKGAGGLLLCIPDGKSL